MVVGVINLRTKIPIPHLLKKVKSDNCTGVGITGIQANVLSLLFARNDPDPVIRQSIQERRLLVYPVRENVMCFSRKIKFF